MQTLFTSYNCHVSVIANMIILPLNSRGSILDLVKQTSTKRGIQEIFSQAQIIDFQSDRHIGSASTLYYILNTYNLVWFYLAIHPFRLKV